MGHKTKPVVRNLEKRAGGMGGVVRNGRKIKENRVGREHNKNALHT